MSVSVVKEHPILMSRDMVLATLAGRKLQTRRLNRRWLKVKAGDVLWVRECWGLFDTQPSDGPENATIFYRATDGDRRDLRFQLWRPSIHMPRWASRITLVATSDARLARLQDITGVEARAEGVGQVISGGTFSDREAVTAFRMLWNDIHSPDAWDLNPEVVVLEFESGAGIRDASD